MSVVEGLRGKLRRVNADTFFRWCICAGLLSISSGGVWGEDGGRRRGHAGRDEWECFLDLSVIKLYYFDLSRDPYTPLTSFLKNYQLPTIA